MTKLSMKYMTSKKLTDAIATAGEHSPALPRNPLRALQDMAA